MKAANSKTNVSRKVVRKPRRVARLRADVPTISAEPRVTTAQGFYRDGHDDSPLFQVCAGIPIQRAEDFAALMFTAVHKSLLVLAGENGDTDGDIAFGLAMQLDMGMTVFGAVRRRP
jgi:hypothetical protein